MLITLAALIFRVALPLGPERTGTTFSLAPELVPISLRAQPVLNEYGLGGQLIFLNVADRAELERTLSEYRITWTIFPAGHPIVSVMDERAGWQRLVEAGGIVIHAREDRLPQ